MLNKSEQKRILITYIDTSLKKESLDNPETEVTGAQTKTVLKQKRDVVEIGKKCRNLESAKNQQPDIDAVLQDR